MLLSEPPRPPSAPDDLEKIREHPVEAMFDSRSIFLNVIEELEASQAFLKSQNASSWPSPHLQVGSVLCPRVSRSPVQVNLDIKSSKCARGTGVKMQAQNPLFLKLWPSHWSNRGNSAASRQNVLMDVLSWGILSRQIWCPADITSWFEKRLFKTNRPEISGRFV